MDINKLTEPLYIIIISFVFWHSMQLKEKWGNYITEPLYVTNGVKQDGILWQALVTIHVCG